MLAPPQNRWLAGPTYEDDDSYLPLQAVDFVAWWMARRRKLEIGAAKTFPECQNELYLPNSHLPLGKPLREHLSAKRLEELVGLTKKGPF